MVVFPSDKIGCAHCHEFLTEQLLRFDTTAELDADAAGRLAADSYSVGILSSSGKGEALGQELGGFGITGSNLSPDDLAHVCKDAMDRWGRIDVLVNSAGHGPNGPILDINDADWHNALDVYLLNVIRAARIVTPMMANTGGGSIINISSFATFEEEAKRLKRIPLGRYGRADEVSSLVAWLASSDGSYMTGQNLRLPLGHLR